MAAAILNLDETIRYIKAILNSLRYNNFNTIVMMIKKAENIDAYIAQFPEHVQVLLEKMRTTIKKAAPTAEETISYGMPAFKLYSNLVYFAAYKSHIGFYPTPSGIKAFSEDIAKYKNSKGAVQFPLDKSFPLALITKIVKFRVAECLERVKSQK